VANGMGEEAISFFLLLGSKIEIGRASLRTIKK